MHLPLKLTCALLLAVALIAAIASAMLPPVATWGIVVTTACMTTAIFLTLNDFSRRLWFIQQTTSNQIAMTAKQTAVEFHAALYLHTRFPGISIPTSTYSMRFANLLAIVNLLDECKPDTVVEFGSGISTLCVASWMKQTGQGRVVSFDHDEQWTAVTRDHLERAGLNEYATVVFAPLSERESLGYPVMWYDIGDELKAFKNSIDFLIVDGPPLSSHSSRMSRIAALDVLGNHLSDKAVVVLDDAARSGERCIIDIWLQTHPSLELTTIPSISGLAIFQSKKSNATDFAATQNSRNGVLTHS